LNSVSDTKAKVRLLSVAFSESGAWLGGALPIPSLGTKLDNESLRIVLVYVLVFPLLFSILVFVVVMLMYRIWYSWFVLQA